MKKQIQVKASSLVPKYWNIPIQKMDDVVFLGKVTIRQMIRYWRHEAESLVSSIKSHDELLKITNHQTASGIIELANKFECPSFPKVGAKPDSSFGDQEPLDAASINRERGKTTFNFCGWCKYTTGGSCRYNYYITTSCQFLDYAGLGEKGHEHKFNTPCVLKTGSDQLFEKIWNGLERKRDELYAEKARADLKIKKLLKLEELSEDKPALPGHRPCDWFNIDDAVACYIGSWDEALIDEQFATAKVITGYRHHDGCVSVCFDQKIHNGDYLDGHGSGYGMSRPEVMHQWEFEYLLNHLDFATFWAIKGTGRLEKFDAELFLMSVKNEALKKTVNKAEEVLAEIRQENGTVTKEFHVLDLLSITTGRLLSPRHMEGVYDILNFMTNDNLFTHQLPRASKECAPFLLQWFPELEKAGHFKNMAKLDELIECAKHRNEPSENGIKMWIKWMMEPGMCNLKEKYPVKRISKEAHQQRDAIEELVEMADGIKTVSQDEGEPTKDFINKALILVKKRNKPVRAIFFSNFVVMVNPGDTFEAVEKAFKDIRFADVNAYIAEIKEKGVHFNDDEAHKTWVKSVNANTQGDGFRMICFAERLATATQQHMAEGETFDSCIELVFANADKDNVTLSIKTDAVVLLSNVWQYGNQLVLWFYNRMRTGVNLKKAHNYDPMCGDRVTNTAQKIVEMANDLNKPVKAKFNDITLIGLPNDDPSIISIYYTAESNRRHEEYIKSPEYKKQQEKAAEAQRKKDLAFAEVMKNAPETMSFKDEEAWKESVEKNSDGYGSGVIKYAETWARMMEARIANGETVEACAKETSFLADVHGITGFMYGCAVSILSQVWKYGEELRRWHNLDTQIGNEGEKANKSGGVLNPALLSIGK